MDGIFRGRHPRESEPGFPSGAPSQSPGDLVSAMPGKVRLTRVTVKVIVVGEIWESRIEAQRVAQLNTWSRWWSAILIAGGMLRRFESLRRDFQARRGAAEFRHSLRTGHRPKSFSEPPQRLLILRVQSVMSVNGETRFCSRGTVTRKPVRASGAGTLGSWGYAIRGFRSCHRIIRTPKPLRAIKTPKVRISSERDAREGRKGGDSSLWTRKDRLLTTRFTGYSDSTRP
jgi:hypothetical protein